jgi:hypothetical protein
MYQFPIMPTDTHHDLAHSALPDAPVVPERPRRRPFLRARHVVASGLHAAARAVEPAPRRLPQAKTAAGVRA